jgi:hypothetical protein
MTMTAMMPPPTTPTTRNQSTPSSNDAVDGAGSMADVPRTMKTKATALRIARSTMRSLETPTQTHTISRTT